MITGIEKAADAILSQEDVFDLLQKDYPGLKLRRAFGGIPDVGKISDVDAITASDDPSSVLSQLPGGTKDEALGETGRLYTLPESSYPRPVSIAVARSVRDPLFRSTKHYQVEKTLREKYPKLYDKARALKETGMKTEPAWASVLGLTGDPYEAMANRKLVLQAAMAAIQGGSKTTSSDLSETKTAAYTPPYGIARLKRRKSKLLDCPIHRWRAESGLELIHREPDLAELQRIWANWQEMTPEQKALSEAKAQELFGRTNEEHYKSLLPLYEKQSVSTDTGLPWRDRAEVFALDPKGRIYGGVWDNDKSFAVPGGGIDAGEDPAQAALRELQEEAGIVADNPRLLPIAPVETPWSDERRKETGRNFAGSRTHFVMADVVRRLKDQKLDKWSAKKRKYYTPAEALGIMLATSNYMSPEVAKARIEALKHIKGEPIEQ